MVIQHNLSALNSHRHMGINNRDTAGALEKLSSGLKVNRAADDAAGLAISEKMRGQIRGLGMAEQNTEHAVDLIKTAEGGLNETHAILQRMRELSVQASNGTYQDDDREQITLEFDALKEEVSRIAQSTHYNGIKLLDGSLGTSEVEGNPVSATDPLNKVNQSTFDIELMGVASNGAFATSAGSVNANFNVSLDSSGNLKFSSAFLPGAAIDGSGFLTFSDGTNSVSTDPVAVDVGKLKELLANLNCYDPTKAMDFTISSSALTLGTADYSMTDLNSSNTGFSEIGINISSATPGPAQEGKHSIEIARSGNSYTLSIKSSGGTVSQVVTLDQLRSGVNLGGVNFQVTSSKKFEESLKGGNISVDNLETKFINKRAPDGPYVFDFGDVELFVENSIVFQIGANGGEDQRVRMQIQNMGPEALGLKADDVLPDGTIVDPGISLEEAKITPIEEANLAIEIISRATQQVSAQRADLGAMQNRLEHTLNNLGVTKENLTAAESVIRDTDMAAAMVEFTRTNILVQAGQAMLAQANQLPQGVLQLLR